jgi:hypothetical protein
MQWANAVVRVNNATIAILHTLTPNILSPYIIVHIIYCITLKRYKTRQPTEHCYDLGRTKII